MDLFLWKIFISIYFWLFLLIKGFIKSTKIVVNLDLSTINHQSTNGSFPQLWESVEKWSMCFVHRLFGLWKTRKNSLKYLTFPRCPQFIGLFNTFPHVFPICKLWKIVEKCLSVPNYRIFKPSVLWNKKVFHNLIIFSSYFMV